VRVVSDIGRRCLRCQGVMDCMIVSVSCMGMGRRGLCGIVTLMVF